MNKRGIIGEIRTLSKDCEKAEFEWKIPKYSELWPTVGSNYFSPKMRIWNTVWIMRIFPNGTVREWNSIEFELGRSNLERNVYCLFCIKRADGKEEKILDHEQYDEYSHICSFRKFLMRKNKLMSISQFTPSDTLAIKLRLYRGHVPYLYDLFEADRINREAEVEYYYSYSKDDWDFSENPISSREDYDLVFTDDWNFSEGENPPASRVQEEDCVDSTAKICDILEPKREIYKRQRKEEDKVDEIIKDLEALRKYKTCMRETVSNHDNVQRETVRKLDTKDDSSDDSSDDSEVDNPTAIRVRVEDRLDSKGFLSDDSSDDSEVDNPTASRVREEDRLDTIGFVSDDSSDDSEVDNPTAIRVRVEDRLDSKAKRFISPKTQTEESFDAICGETTGNKKVHDILEPQRKASKRKREDMQKGDDTITVSSETDGKHGAKAKRFVSRKTQAQESLPAVCGETTRNTKAKRFVSRKTHAQESLDAVCGETTRNKKAKIFASRKTQAQESLDAVFGETTRNKKVQAYHIPDEQREETELFDEAISVLGEGAQKHNTILRETVRNLGATAQVPDTRERQKEEREKFDDTFRVLGEAVRIHGTVLRETIRKRGKKSLIYEFLEPQRNISKRQREDIKIGDDTFILLIETVGTHGTEGQIYAFLEPGRKLSKKEREDMEKGGYGTFKFFIETAVNHPNKGQIYACLEPERKISKQEGEDIEKGGDGTFKLFSETAVNHSNKGEIYVISDPKRKIIKVEREDMENGDSPLRRHPQNLRYVVDIGNMILKVKHQEFKVHKRMLRSLSPAFASMFKHITKESEDGGILIEDCDPNAFGDFLKYIYTDKVEDLSPSKAMGLYYIAIKYDLQELKEICVEYLKVASLSTTIVCDIISRATILSEHSLRECIINFFSKNVVEITATVEWQRFREKNFAAANELYIKALERRKENVSNMKRLPSCKIKTFNPARI